MASETESEPADELSNALGCAVAFNPDRLFPATKNNHTQRRFPSLKAPLTFYDRHINGKLQLRHIRHMPLDLFVSHTIHVALESFRDRNIELPSDAGDNFFQASTCGSDEQIVDASSVAYTYQTTMGSFASCMSSALLADLQSNGQVPFLLWKVQPQKDDESLTAYTDAFGLQLATSETTDEYYPTLDSHTQKVFQRLREVYPVMAWWEVFFLSEETETLIKDMGGDASINFYPELVQLSEFGRPPPSTYAPPIDAAVTPWGESLSADYFDHVETSRAGDKGEQSREPVRRSLRLKAIGSVKGRRSNLAKSAIKPERNSVDASWPDVTIPTEQD
ncbi:hypothetical protein H0H87_000521, partial [Tephrocybe sp. NHM501043]